MRKKYYIIIFMILLLVFTCSCAKQKVNVGQNLGAKQNFKNIKYEAESNNWKVVLKQHQSNDLDIAISYKGLEKISGEIKFKYYLDNGYSSEGSILKTNDSKDIFAEAKIPVDESSKRQLKITKATIEYNNKSEDILLKYD